MVHSASADGNHFHLGRLTARLIIDARTAGNAADQIRRIAGAISSARPGAVATIHLPTGLTCDTFLVSHMADAILRGVHLELAGADRDVEIWRDAVREVLDVGTSPRIRGVE